MKKLILCGTVLWIGLFCGGCVPVELGITSLIYTTISDFILGLIQGGAV